MREVEPTRLALQLFGSYYKRLKPEDVNVSGFQKREFAFSHFGEEGMRRHMAFTDPRELLSYLAVRVPRHAYRSSAYYRDPAAKTMEEKGWEGADLVFDIDVDHVETPCKELHDRWTCKSCGASGWGAAHRCSSCGGETLERHTWVCDACISVARDEILKLTDFLENDLGFSSDEFTIIFSGHRGFHVHVESPTAKGLSQDGRREIVEYVRGLGVDVKHLVIKAGGGFKLRFGSGAPGWHGRVARWALIKTGVEDPILSLKEWEEILGECIGKEAVAIDEKVTIDTKRLVRLPNTLHGKTGLRAAPFTIRDLERENPLEGVKAFTEGEVVVDFKVDPPKRVLDMSLSPSTRTLPLYVALYMLLNGAEFSKFLPL